MKTVEDSPPKFMVSYILNLKQEPGDATFFKIIQIVENFQDVTLYDTITKEIQTQDSNKNSVESMRSL